MSPYTIIDYGNEMASNPVISISGKEYVIQPAVAELIEALQLRGDKYKALHEAGDAALRSDIKRLRKIIEVMGDGNEPA